MEQSIPGQSVRVVQVRDPATSSIELGGSRAQVGIPWAQVAAGRTKAEVLLAPQASAGALDGLAVMVTFAPARTRITSVTTPSAAMLDLENIPLGRPPLPRRDGRTRG